jgi:hypothetical protein
MAAAAQAALRTCPRCGVTDTQELIVEAAYHCRRCAFELAHLEIGVSGGIRRVVGWLHAPNDLVGERYRVTTVLGKGGYAATYLVADTRIAGKRRALKEIPEHLYDEHETELLSRLRHRAVPDITDRFAADGMVYLVLEFGGTQTLESERRRCGGRVPVDRVAGWVRQLCDVLAYLHAQTPPVVHRDLKPANVLLDERDHVMLIDFGIAKEALGLDATRTLARAASHGFSPPEQVLGTGTDSRSDVYALGATVYALLTGRVPPPAHERLLGTPLVPPRRLQPAISPALEDGILRALDLRPELRPHSVEELRAAFAGESLGPAATLDDALTVPVALVPAPDAPTRPALGDSPTAPAVHRPATPRVRALGPSAATAAALLVLAGGLAILRPWRPATPRPGMVTRMPAATPGSTVTTLAAAPTTTVTSPPPSTTTAAPVTDAPPPSPPEPLQPRIRALLAADEFSDITIAVDQDRIRLRRLPSEAAAQRARDIVLTSLPDLELPIDVEVLPPPAPSSPAASVPHPTPPSPRRPRTHRPRQRATRPSKSPPHRRRRAQRSSPPAEWVLIPQPARRTD